MFQPEPSLGVNITSQKKWPEVANSYKQKQGIYVKLKALHWTANSLFVTTVFKQTKPVNGYSW